MADTPEQQSFQHLLGQLVIVWNHAEDSVRWLVARLMAGKSGHLLVAEAACTEMKPRTLSNTLDTLAEITYGDGPEKDLLTHVTKLYGGLVSWRNHYVHTVMSVTDGRGDSVHKTGQGKFGHAVGKIEPYDLTKFMLDALRMEDFVRKVETYFVSKWNGTPVPSPGKPPLPSRLTRTYRTLPVREPQPLP